MLTLNDGRSELWQWDTGRKLTVDADCSQVHFSNKVFGRSIDVDVVVGVAIIPDILLQTDKELTAWAFVGTAENGYTKISKTFKVNKRNKPADYVFTPTEQTTLDEIMKRLSQIEESQDPDAIKNAVDEYLANNPIQVEEKDPTVPDWAKQPTKPEYTVQEVGAVATVNGIAPDENGNVQIPVSGGNVDQEQITIAINTALAQAKASGEFDGKDGKDYVLTEADKQEVAQEAAELVEVPDVDIPTTLPNPNALTFTGAATGTYDGSAPMTVEIPQGGSGGGSFEWELIGEVTSDGAGDVTGISIPCDLSGYKQVFVVGANLTADSKFRIVVRSSLVWHSALAVFGYNVIGQAVNVSGFDGGFGKMNGVWSITGTAYNIDGRILAYGAAEAKSNGGSAPWRQGHQDGTAPQTGKWDEIKYISLDRNSNTDIVPEGCTLIAWGLK